MVFKAKRPNPGKKHLGSMPFPARTRNASERLAAATRNLQVAAAGAQSHTTLKDSSLIMEILFKNVFLKGAIKSVEQQQKGGSAYTDMDPGAPNKLWEAIIEGAEREAGGSFRSLGSVSGDDVVFLITNVFGLYSVRPETKLVVSWNFKRIWGFSHEDWHKASKEQKAFTITDVAYKDLFEIGTLAFGTNEQKRAMGFKRGF